MDDQFTIYIEKMHKTHDNLMDELATIRAGRANPQYSTVSPLTTTARRPRSSRWAMFPSRRHVSSRFSHGIRAC